MAVGVLLDDDHEEPVLEADGYPEPVEALGAVFLRCPAAVLAGDRAHSPTAVAGAGPRARREGEFLALDADGAGDVAGLDEAAAFQHEAVPAALDVVGLPDGGELGGPGDVVREALGVVGVGVAVQADPLEGLVDGDAERADGEVHPVVAEGVGGADGEEFVADAQGGVGVDDARVGVDAEAEDEDGPAGVVEDVEDAAVVGVAVAADEVLHRQRRLVDGVFVERDGPVGGHGGPPGRGRVAARDVAWRGWPGVRRCATRADMTVRQKPFRGTDLWHYATGRHVRTPGSGGDTCPLTHRPPHVGGAARSVEASGTRRTDGRGRGPVTRGLISRFAVHDHA